MKRPVAALLALFITACGSSRQSERPEPPLTEPPAATNDVSSRPSEEPPPETATDTSTLPIIAVGPVARVDGVDISAATFNHEVARLVRMMGSSVPPSMVVTMKDQIIQNLVQQKLIDRLVATLDIELDPAMVDEYIEKRKALYPNEAAPLGTADEVRADIEQSLRLRAHLRQNGSINVTDADVRAYFDKNRAMFDKPEQTKASHILLKVDRDADDDTVARAAMNAAIIAEKARQPDADFGALAREHSEGPTAPRGGDLGYFPRKRMVPEFDEVVWRLDPGEISEPVRTQFGYHVIKVFDRKPAVKADFKRDQHEIRERLEQHQTTTALKKLTQQLRNDADIEQFADNVQENPNYVPPNQEPREP